MIIVATIIANTPKVMKSHPITGIPVFFIDKLFPVFIPNVACCVHLEYNWYMYIVIFAVIMLIYQIISVAITGKLNKITPAEVLKNRE